MDFIEVRESESRIGVEPSARSLAQLYDSGVVLLDKPRGPSSHEVSSFVKKMLEIRRAGHSGTLDPDVSGVLPVMLGSATKVAPLLLGSTKEYVCVARFEEPVDEKNLTKAFENFRGKVYQTPPLESAVKKALRVREVYSLDVLELKGRLVLFESKVQGGTYIRTIVRDLGLVLGIQAEMAELRRTVAAGVKEGACVSLQELSDRLWLARERGDEKPLRQCILPLESVVKLKRIYVDDSSLKPLTSGANLSFGSVIRLQADIVEGSTVGLFSGKGELYAIAKSFKDAGEIAKKAALGERGVCADVVRVVKQV